MSVDFGVDVELITLEGLPRTGSPVVVDDGGLDEAGGVIITGLELTAVPDALADPDGLAAEDGLEPVQPLWQPFEGRQWAVVEPQ